MKWFKHLTTSKSNKDIMESEVKFKSQGPYVFWRVLEILASENAIDKPLKMNFKVFKMWFPSVTCNKLNIILTFFQHKNRIIFKVSDEEIIISCPKLTEISSDYNSKVRSNLKVKSKRVSKMSALDLESKNKNKRIEEEKNIYKKFDKLSLTVKEFEKLNEEYSKEDIDSILEDIENYKGSNKYKSLYKTAIKWLKKNNSNFTNNFKSELNYAD
ncbi:hypothetical protein KAR91_41190 [Candidatus Pacearchaeota archaeon]|nr:hypothetical protein [Candidatus Pacearchaeota archaeon]